MGRVTEGSPVGDFELILSVQGALSDNANYDCAVQCVAHVNCHCALAEADWIWQQYLG